MGGHTVVKCWGALGTRPLLREMRHWYVVNTEHCSNMDVFAFKSVPPNFSNLGAHREYFSYNTLGLTEEATDGWNRPVLGAALS